MANFTPEELEKYKKHLEDQNDYFLKQQEENLIQKRKEQESPENATKVPRYDVVQADPNNSKHNDIIKKAKQVFDEDDRAKLAVYGTLGGNPEFDKVRMKELFPEKFKEKPPVAPEESKEKVEENAPSIQGKVSASAPITKKAAAVSTEEPEKDPLMAAIKAESEAPKKQQTDFVSLLEQAKQARNRQQLLAGIGRAGETLSSAITGMVRGGVVTKPTGTDFYKDLAKQAEQGIEDVGTQYKFETAQEERDRLARRRDPNSEESKFARDLLKKQGITVPEGATAEALEKYAPQLTNILNQREAQKSREMMARERAEDRALTREMALGQKQKEEISEEKQKLEKRLAGPGTALKAIDDLESEIKTKYLKDPTFSFDTFDIKKFKGDLPGKSIPGLGRVSLYSSEARQLQKDIDTVLNEMIRNFAGKAVTKNELERIKSQFSSGAFNTEAEMLDAMAKAKRLARAGMKSTEAAFSKKARQQYEEEGGITSQYNLPEKQEEREDIRAYADDHFGGDYNKALTFLKQTGKL